MRLYIIDWPLRLPLGGVAWRARSAAGGFPSGFCWKHQCNVRFAPKATKLLRCRELTQRANRRHRDDLFNDLVGHCENLRRQIEAERFRGFKIDHEFELGYSHHWQISGLLAL